MKILFYIDSLGSAGKERRLVELMKAIKASREIEFELATMSRLIHYREVFDLNIKIHYLVRETKKDFSVFYRLYKLCKIMRPDLIHCWDSMTAVYSVPVCKVLHIPLINGMVTNSPLRWNIFNTNLLRSKLTFPFSNYIVGNSKAGILAYRAPSERSYIIHNGFDFNRINNIIEKKIILKELNIKTKFVVGMVASFSKAKDYKTFLSAAQTILKQRTDVTFVAIGYQTDSIIIKSLIETKWSQYFKFLGIKTDIESYINAMDICVLSTFSEGISNSILEYMALGKPVVATEGGGTNEILIDNQTGFLVKTSDSKDLSEKIQMLLQNENLRINMGNSGKKCIQEKFSIDKMTNKYISLYKEVI